MLQVIKAEEVRDGEPRWWCPDDVYATRTLEWIVTGNLHTEWRREADAFALAIVDRPAPTPPHAPGLDLDAVERAERAMTPGPWPIIDPNDREPGPPVWHGSNFGGVTAIGPIHYDSDEDETQPGSPAHLRAEADSRGIVALRNAAPALIAEVRALRAALAEAKRLGLEAVALARDAIEAARDNTRGATGHTEIVESGVMAAGCLNVAAAIAAALEAL